MHKLILKPGREKSLKRRHPWIFSGGVARVEGNPQAGDTVEVRAADGARSQWRPTAPIADPRARLGLGRADIDADFLRAHPARRGQREMRCWPAATDGARLIHGESDGLPGIVRPLWRHGGSAVLSAGAERWRGAIDDALAALPACPGTSVRRRCARARRIGAAHRPVRGHPPDC